MLVHSWHLTFNFSCSSIIISCSLHRVILFSTLAFSIITYSTAVPASVFSSHNFIFPDKHLYFKHPSSIYIWHLFSNTCTLYCCFINIFDHLPNQIRNKHADCNQTTYTNIFSSTLEVHAKMVLDQHWFHSFIICQGILGAFTPYHPHGT